MLTVRDDFYNLRTSKDVAKLLGITHSKFIYYLYKHPKDNKYFTFELKKKSGGFRKISAPIPPILYVQQKLLDVFHEVYVPRPCVHGAVRDRSIVTNASKHTKSRFVINFDLKDFFPSIHFGRVKGLLVSHPYSLPDEVANIIANVCCHQGALPQGAPTSPIIANMICHGMDREFQRLSKKHGFFYTRYFDDITFSTKRKNIPNGIAYRLDTDNNPYTLGKEILEIVNKNGFSINNKKTRVQCKLESQTVTGLKVNRFPNINRNFIRQLRAMLHAWERYGYKGAQSEFKNKYDHKSRLNTDTEFRRVIKGKIDFLKMVRGGENDIYKKMIRKYRILETRDFYDNALYKKPVFSEEQLKTAIFVFEYEWESDGEWDGTQGTAFALHENDFITCAHVLPPEGAKILRAEAWRCDNTVEKYKIEILKINRDIDLAILLIHASVEFPLAKAERLTFLGHHSKVIVAGFPNYRLGDELYISSGHVTQRTRVSGLDRYIVSVAIVEGNSGGPVLNDNNQVVGIAATGISGKIKTGATHYHSFIPVSALIHLK